MNKVVTKVHVYRIKAAQIITDLRQNSSIKTISVSGQG